MSKNIEPVSGWMLDCVAALDYGLAGFAGAYLRTSNERRQVLAAYLSVKEPCLKDMTVARECADYLISANHDDILTTAFSTMPVGFRGALRRSGPQPHHKRFYSLLHEMLATPPHQEIRMAIQQSDSLDLERLRIIRKLPAGVCTATIAASLENLRAAGDFALLVGLMLDSGLERKPLVAAFRQVVGARSLIKTVKRWSFKVSLPPHPVPASTTYHPVETAAALKHLSARYRNCAAQYLARALDGTDAFAEFKRDPAAKRGIVVHLRKREASWQLEGLFAQDNGMPDPETRCGALNYLKKHGVEERRRIDVALGPWSALSRFVSPGFFDDHPDFD